MKGITIIGFILLSLKVYSQQEVNIEQGSTLTTTSESVQISNAGKIDKKIDRKVLPNKSQAIEPKKVVVEEKKD